MWVSSMWWPVLFLCAGFGAVFGNEVTLPVSVKFGDGLLSFSKNTNGLFYTINEQDGLTVENSISTGESKVARNNQEYTLTECSTNEEACVEFIINDVNVILKKDLSNRASSVSHVVVNSSTDGVRIGACVELGDGVDWFGGPEAKYQLWPVQDAQWNYTAYYTKEDDAVAIAEPYWLSSQGTYLYVNPATSMFIDQNYLNEGSLCIYAENVTPYRERNYTSLEYWIGRYEDPRTAHEAAVEEFFAKPTDVPDERMIAQPVWSTWARYKIYVNDTIVRQYAQEILDNGFNHSQLEIDDFWETCYGSLTFNTSDEKFPDIKGLTNDLHDLGFRVTLWVHPFINVDCTEYYSIAESAGYFAKDVNGTILTTWWQGENASVIDFTNEAAVEWFTSRLTALQASAGIDSFKFDAGEASWAPEPAVLTGNVEESPSIYTYQYARALATFGNGIEVRTGWQTQDLAIFVRMLDKDTSWTFENGLPTLITTLLVMNLAGYGFVLPDMVGGNGYIDGVLVSTQYPSKELFIRWLQANTFMPSIQYSFVPWDYDNETVEICRTYTELHEAYAPTIIEAMNALVANGTPVNPPVWWLDPTNSEAYNISDEYLLGEVILVAPVVVEGAVTRDIFLPNGTWRDATYGTYDIYEGPTWIYDYPAPLEVLPYFVESSYWETLSAGSGAFLPSSSLTVIYTSAILALLIQLFN
ncbi:myogenesis-regulating glycosidase-like [Neodiprion fabricii]|uniref:myogenesis-regulating glycosidase-like n=1 Tax=Neodiprion fabricii TaxID=2872261 RepID=UPI001ED95DD6|nr:myogenesis-regulating glycosidase-like [Neodiprion fabricii]